MSDWKYNVEDCFDEEGNFAIKGFDPYRCDEEEKDFYNALFYTYEYSVSLRFSVEKYILNFLNGHDKTLSWDCDMVQLIHYDNFACNTKGNYDVRYGWR